ncbi:MAG TPA: hypothetical protein HPP83_05365, partial [Candidatus Hydrogenedentes bacterium]|nr:hypothetical protein [Candidatus Hydrogenedentota bacterium]
MSRALQECTKRLRGFFHVVRRFVPLVFPYWDKVILRILCSQGISTVGVVSALATGKAIDEGLIARSPATFYFWAGLLVFFAVYNLVYLATFATVATYIRMRLDFRLKRLIFDHAQRLSLRFHEHRPVGENMYRINYDTVDATDIAGNTLPELLERIVMILTTCTLLFVLNPFVALLIATYVAIYYVYSHIVITYAYRLQ